MEKFKVIFIFEFMGYMKSKGFIIATILFAFAALLLPTIPTIWGTINLSRERDNRAVIIDSEHNHNADLLNIYFPDVSFIFRDDLYNALSGLENGDYEWVLQPISRDLHVPTMNIASLGLQSTVSSYLREVYRREIFISYGLSANVVDDFLDMTIPVDLMAQGGATDLFMRDYFFAYGLIFLLYIMLTLYCQFITTSVVTEKSSKAMEILITAAKPLYLIFGKVIGVTAAGMFQMAIILTATIISFIVNGMFWVALFFDGGALIYEDAAIDPQLLEILMAPVDPFILIYFALFFLLGFLMYAFIYAALASTASRIEDVSTVQTIPMLLLLAGFFATMFGLGNSGAGFIVVLSYVPFFSPMLMLMRYTMGTVGHGGVIISIIVLFLSTIFMGYLSAKLYRIGVLMYGNPPKVMSIIKMLLVADVRK